MPKKASTKTTKKKAKKSTSTGAKKKTTKKTTKSATVKKATKKKAATKKKTATTTKKAATKSKKKPAKSTKSTSTSASSPVSASIPPPITKAYFTKQELVGFKDDLISKREELLEDLKEFAESVRAANRDQLRGDAADLAAGEIESNLQARMQDKKRKLLAEVQHALSKFEDGTYGICEGSQEYISKNRLKIRPWTKYSIEYKEFVDEMKKKNSR